jgi:4-hydroxy-tetrahydrodipicolinate reductase
MMNRNLRIVLIGYGKMGKAIEKLAIEKNHEIVAVIDSPEHWIEKQKEISTADVAIDFSIPQAALTNIDNCLKINLPLVVGTTGWYDKLPQVQEAAENSEGAILWASNFSLGVQILFHLNARLAEIMNRYPEYSPGIQEIHHTQKLDAPSGTAIQLANGILQSYPELNGWYLIENESYNFNALPVFSQRIGQVTGTHHISYSSSVDTITISHEAKNREGFVFGAVLAAEWLVGKRGFFTMKDVLGF